MTDQSKTVQTRDVLIVGAGISGIGMACHLADDCPDQSLAILEKREAIGGTWDLFRYPGIRSDSDMFSFGYKFRPWEEPKTLSDGGSIREYLVDTAREYGVADKICFGRTIQSANWSSDIGRWTVTASNAKTGTDEVWQCRHLILCTGYYRYDAGYMPDFPGMDRYKGQLIHPQHWPQDLDYRDKKVVVIGSGATAITLLPAMAGETSHITMLQRSPSYVVSLPAIDQLSVTLKRFLPDDWVFRFARQRNIQLQRLMYTVSRKHPWLMRKLLLAQVRRQLKGKVDMRHFTPDYDPWDQRLCVVPNGDLFKVLRSDKADIVTDQIDSFTENGIRLKSGETLEADIVISATGLNMDMLSDAELTIDGVPHDASQGMTYKGVLLEGVPNFAAIFGYTNASWTLKADIAAAYVCRLINHMQRHGYDTAIAEDSEAHAEDSSIMDALNSNYVARASHRLPRQGDKPPWRVLNHYARDRKMLLEEPIEDGVIEFGQVASRAARRNAA